MDEEVLTENFMFKFRKSFTWAVLACTALCAGLTSCGLSDDDDDLDTPEDLWKGELSDAKYENDAVFYEVTNSNEIASIELTASGDYIIMPTANSTYYAPAQTTRAGKKSGITSMFHKDRKTTRSAYEYAVFGSYTKNADGTYTLDGFGVLGIYDNGKISLVRNDGQKLSLDVVKKGGVESSSLNSRFCRTWEIIEVYEEVFDSNGRRIASDKLTDQEIREDFVRAVLVSKAGTFTQIEWDNTLESYGNWWWSNEALQIFGYQFVDEDYPGEEGVKFDGDRAIFFAQEYGNIDDEDYDYGVSSGDYILQERVVCRAR